RREEVVRVPGDVHGALAVRAEREEVVARVRIATELAHRRLTGSQRPDGDPSRMPGRAGDLQAHALVPALALVVVGARHGEGLGVALDLLAGHAVGLLTPIVVFDTLGISHGAKQVLAMSAGGIAGVFCLTGLLMLIHRRLFDPRIRANSSLADILILFLLLFQLLLGLITITVSMQHLDGHEMVKFMEWAQHIVTFRGGANTFIADVAFVFKAHITLGLFLLLVFPFTRLVHALSVPVGYIFRPYQIVRRRAK
ncbi:MAG TPA: respiratory nitrate reductase subunit gamma, partial [Emcibacteraceae bacterium]|nr:respiratory nitrate reductase subunit gamma [Emcibacteraceae bacterium]